MSDITGFKDMKPKRYPLHHDHGTVTISRDVFETMSKELERLRPMETGLELAEADRDAYSNRVDDLKKAQRWRKVCEEKPRNGDLILALLSERTKGHYFPMDVVRWDSSYELGEIEVTHWMPLPNPPEDITR